MAEIAFGISGTILEKLGSFAYEEICLASGMKYDLKKLEQTTSLLKAMLHDAEKKQQRNTELKEWLIRLKDVFNDAVDVLDEFECEVLRRQVVKKYGSVGRKVRRFFSRSNPLVFRFSIAHQIKEIRQRLDEIFKEMAPFQLVSTQPINQEQIHRHDLMQRTTHSFVDPKDVIGRDDDKARVICMLDMYDQDNDRYNLSVIPIFGIGGLGKTTLAKSIYNDKKVVERFDLKSWACVSLDFNWIKLAREILKSATNAREDLCNLSTDQLQRSLRGTLEGKRFLLVLDDVWNEDRNKWIELRDLLTGGAEGSKIIVTTRSTSVASIMSRIPPHRLEGLSEEDSLSLFFKHAFGDEKLAPQHPQLRDIGKEIVEKCSGVPLALKTLGSRLFSKSEVEWKSVRDNDIWKLEEEDGHILPALRLSYNALSPCLKQCFASCATFPEDEEMLSLELIWIWMALGIIQTPNHDKMEPEDIGELNVKTLCARSFLQIDDDLSGLIYTCQMHDLIHELARSITQHECYVLSSGREKLPDTVRHLRMVLEENNLSTLPKLKKVHSIYVDSTPKNDNVIDSFLSTCISRFRYLRVFALRDLSFEVLPRSIGTLKHLRLLNLNGNKKIKKLPDSICKLQSLQSLLLEGCVELEELPRDIRNLDSLRNLFLTTKQACLPENGVGGLRSLQFLWISECENLKSLPTDLIWCTTLRTLMIIDCEQLDLASGPTVNEVARLSLQTLVIEGLPKSTGLPQWLKGAADTLRHLDVQDCEKLAALPEWFSNLRSLEKLVIKNCKTLLSLPEGMQHLTSLRHLDVQDCEKLAALPEWFSNLRSLEKLVIKNCKTLLSLPEGMQHLTSLKELTIEDCNVELHKRCKREIGVDWPKIAHVPNLSIGHYSSDDNN